MSIAIQKVPYRLILYLLFGIGLIIILSWLILSHYQAQVALQKELQKELIQDLKHSDLLVTHFFESRLREIQLISQDQFVTSYFANKALGMSLEYGLRASLIQIENLIKRVKNDKEARYYEIYSELAVLDLESNIIAANNNTHKGYKHLLTIENKRRLAETFKSNPLIQLYNSKIYIIKSIILKDKNVGFILAIINICPWFEEIILRSSTKIKGSIILVGCTKERAEVICGDPNLSLPQGLNTVLNRGPHNEKIKFNTPQTYTIALPIGNTPVYLLSLNTKGKTPTTQRVTHILYFLLGLLLVFLSGLSYLIRSEIKSARLKMKMATEERNKRLLLEGLNRKLDAEVLERSKAQKKLKEKNNLLAGVNQVLLLALRSSSLYEVAQAHLKLAQARTNSTAGFVGLYKEQTEFVFLAMDESVDDTCRLYLNDLKTAHGDMSKTPLLRKALTKKQIILINNMSNSSPSLPAGHPKLDSLILIPLEVNRSSIVLIALGNKPGGYTQQDSYDLAELSTFFVTAINQKITENELKVSEERNRTLVESITEGLIVVNQDAQLDYINDNMLALLGLDRDQAEGFKIYDFLDIRNEEKLRKKWRSRRIGIAEPYELTWQSVDGSPIQTMVYPRPIIGPKGEFCGSVALITDLTKQKGKEAQILQAQKLEAIGQLAAGIAHEINTPTNYVSNNILFLQDIFQDILGLLQTCNKICEQAPQVAEANPQLNAIKQATREYNLDYMLDEVPNAIAETLDGLKHITKIVQSMKEFAHPSAESLSTIDINEAIKNTATVAKNEWKYVAELTMDLDQDLPKISCLAGQINQVLLNMIVNSAQAISKKKEENPEYKGVILIRTARIKDNLQIIIKDNGEGIPENLQKRVFEPFFTTKEPGKGTGQGLAISHSIIVEKHKGAIVLESKQGEGAQFTITLPLEFEDGSL